MINFNFDFVESECQRRILSLEGIQKISLVLKHPSVTCACDAIATLLQINSSETAPLIFTAGNVATVQQLRETEDIPLRNFVTIYLEAAAAV